MAYQYLYPSGDLITANWLNTDSGVPLYPYVDEGVSSYDDDDFMYLIDASPTLSGDLNYVTSGEFKFDLGELLCHPTLVSGSILVNFRAKAPLGDWKLGDMYLHDSVGTVIARHTGFVNIDSGTAYEEYQARFNSFNWLGSWNDYDLTNTTLLAYSAVPSGSTSIDAYISAVELVSSGWIVDNNDSTTLYIPGQTDYDEIPLYLHVWNPDSGQIPLWIGGAFVQDDITLYLRGLSSGEMDIDLYAGGHITTSGNTTLYIRGFDVASGELPLFIDGWGEEVTDEISLHTKAGLVGGGGANPTYISLYMLADPTNETVPLYTAGPPSEVTTTNMSLFIRRAYEWDDGDISLFINDTLTWSGIPLFMQGPSGTDGAIPYSGEMYLYISRESEGVDYSMPLYVSGPDPDSGNATLFIEGGPSLHGDITLVIPNAIEEVTDDITLYTHGF